MYERAQNRFSLWEDFSKSYVIGRAIWRELESDNSKVASIAAYLLTEPESPWVPMEW